MPREHYPYLSMSTLLVAWLLVMVLVLPFSGAAADDEFADSGVLKGTVFNLHYDSGVPHAYVLVESEVGYKEARTTDETGDYKFNLPYGTYSMRVFVRDQEMDNASGIFVDPSAVVHDVYISFAIEEPVHLHGVIKVEGYKTKNDRVVFEGIGNSYSNETVTDEDGKYSLDIPYGKVHVSVYEGDDFVGEKTIGPFVVAGDQEVKMDIIRTGEAPSFDEWTDFIVATWTGMAIWGAVVFGLIMGYFYLSRRVNKWIAEEDHRYSQSLSEMIAYSVKGYARVLFLYVSMLVLDVFLTIDSGAAVWIRFWICALVMVLALWVSARLLMLVIDYVMIRLRQQRVKEGSEVPETAYIFIHGILRYLVIAIFGFGILLIVLSGAGLYDEIMGGFTGFIDLNFGYLVFIVIVVVLYVITNRFVKLTFTQMSQTSTRFTPQLLRIFGFMVKIAIVGLFSVLIIFILLTMAGMQEMGALIMALLTTTVGMIVAMTTTGAIGNALAGMVIMTLKPIVPGQYVKIGDDQFGYVLDIGTFFTTLKTFENVIVEIPNNLVLATEIKNYSKRKNIGMEVDFGINYDVPADIVLELMKKGAKGTRNIVRDPKPAAMITSFGDFAVHYKLRAFTDKVDYYFLTKSALMENLQMLFYEEGVEIMTPWQMVKREDIIPKREDVIKKYMENMKHQEADGKTIAAGLDMLEANDTKGD